MISDLRKSYIDIQPSTLFETLHIIIQSLSLVHSARSEELV